MIDLKSANRKALNEHARTLLVKVGLEPDRGKLHVSQLMLHFLREGGHGLANRNQATYLTGLLERIHAEDPVLLMKFMTLTGPESSVNKARLLTLESPQQVTQIMLQALHRETTAAIETYP